MAKLIDAINEAAEEQAPKPSANHEWYAECWRRMRKIMQCDAYIEKEMELVYRGKMVAELAAARGKINMSGIMELVRITEDTPLPATLAAKRDDLIARTKSVRDWILHKMYNPNVKIDTALQMAMQRKKLLIELGGMGWLPVNNDWCPERKPMTDHGMRERMTQANDFKADFLASMDHTHKVSAHE